MKLNNEENQSLSAAIDQIQEGFNTVIEMYNESEDEKQPIMFTEDVIELIEKAKQTVGEEQINRKINTLVKEVLSFFPFHDDVQNG